MNKITKLEELAKEENAQTEIEKARALQEVQAQILVARQCPRDEQRAYRRIMDSAKRKSLAESAIYSYPKGDTLVNGASIRTAENIAKYWGNIAFGIKEISQDLRFNTSEMMAYAWDLENNVRQERIFKVQHKRDTKKGSYVLTSSRDIYELTANQGARRLRACILGIIPTYVVEDFIQECEKTLAGNNTESLKERTKKMIKSFEELGISQEQIEARIGTRADNFIEKHLIDLRGVYQSIKDNFANIGDYFKPLNLEKEDSSKPIIDKK